MKSMTVAVVVAAMIAGPCRADTIPQLLDVPSTYTPGVPFSFEIVVPQLADFSSFNLNLIADAAVDAPDLTLTAARSSTQDVFSGTGSFSSSSTVGPSAGPPALSANEVLLNVTGSGGFTLTNQGTPPNNTLAVVTVTPGADLTGPITLSFDSSSTLSYDVEGFGDTLPNPVTIDQGPPLTTVPTPAAWLSLTLGGLLLGGRNRLLRKRTQ